MKDTAKRVMRFSYLAAAATAGALILRGKASWAAGLMVGVIWSVINFSLTVNLFEVALLRKEPKRVKMALMIKFPVLYITGFLILKYDLFPVMSILAGIGLALFVIGVTSIWPKRV